MPSKYKPTRDRKQRRAPKGIDAAQSEGISGIPSARNTPPAVDPNVDIIIPLTGAEKKEKRRIELRGEMKEGQPKMSSKKQKRLNKYIENKLKKEERIELMQKLSETKVDTSLFRSTKTIGAAKESKREQMRRALLEEKFGINMEENAKILYEERRIREPEELESEKLYKPVEGTSGGAQEKAKKDGEDEQVEIKVLETKNIPVGSGLKRPLEPDANGQPIIKRIKKSREARKERLIAMIEAMEREKEQEEGSSSIDEDESGSNEDGDEEMDDGDTKKGSDDEEEEEWEGIPDSPVGENTDRTVDDTAGVSDEEAISGRSDSDSSGTDGEDDESEAEDHNDDDEGDDEGEPVPRLKRGRSEKANAFKEWALAQRKEVMNDGNPSGADTSMPDLLALGPKAVHVHVPRKMEEDITPPPELQGPSVERKAYYVTIDRPEDIQAARLGLPVVGEEQRIMEAIHNNPCVVICGETGSGKTTQVPQFLYEAGYGSPDSKTPGLIGVTQPRRVAAVSMAKRVGDELGTGGNDKVAYQIRFEGTVNPKTAIKFMTDGVLLRELAEDFLLKKYSAIIIDEAHERSINTDILIGVMSRVLKLREQMNKADGVTKPLKLIIMSATLRVSDFTENRQLFPKPPPLLKVEARQHPVTVHFSRRTASDYVEETFKKVCKIHRRLPPGGILVFLTGQNEITAVLRKLCTTFPFKDVKMKSGRVVTNKQEKDAPPVRISAREAAVETEDVDFGNLSELGPDESDADSILDEDDNELGDEMAATDTDAPLYVLPLYSLLPTKDQLKVFEEAPEGSRMCVLATNVAETSLTIPGIRYVVDCGRSKERNFDKVTGVQSFDIGWVSKASASQRAGRSGRTGPGHCYKLYSSAIYERDFSEFAEAEILRMPIEGVVLQMKSMNIDTIANFPFPTAPDRPSLQKAEKLLGFLGALDPKGSLTDLGQTMNIFPLSPRFSKILIIGQQHGCLPYIIAIVAALSVGEVFVPEHQLDINEPDELEDGPPDNETMIERTQRANRRKAYYRAHRNFSSLDATCDALKLLSVVCAYEYETRQADFCERNFIRLKAMQETHKLRQQITNIVRASCPGVMGPFEARVPPPSTLQVKAIKQIVAVGFIDQVAIRADLVPNSTFKLGQSSLKKVTDVPYMTLFASSVHQSGPNSNLQDVAVYIHPSSVLASQSSYPEYLVYSELKKSVSATGKVRMRPLTSVSGSQLAALAKGTPLITYSKPLDHVPPKVLPDSGGNQRECWVIPRIGGAIGKSELGWPLPARKVIQKKEGGKWVIE